MVELFIKEGKASIKMENDIISEVVNDLKHAADEAIDKKCLDIDIDMSGVQYINSSGIGILLGLHSRLKEKKGTLRLKNVCTDLEDLFDSMNLLKVFSLSLDTE